jgi:hypothetical protein
MGTMDNSLKVDGVQGRVCQGPHKVGTIDFAVRAGDRGCRWKRLARPEAEPILGFGRLDFETPSVSIKMLAVGDPEA